MELILFSCFAAAFLVTMILVPKWVRKAVRMGLVGGDMNKPGRPKVAEAGGITVIAGAVFGILLYIFLKTFYFYSGVGLIEIFAVLTTILLAGFIGFIDDILGWKAGIRHSTKVLSTIPIAIPLAAVNVGESTMMLPFFGPVNFGVLFPLVLIPLGIIGATNGYNMLAGYNGLEAGMGVIILSTMGVIAWMTGLSWVSMISFCIVFALLAFFVHNRPPAKIFPGDSLTYSTGAAIACIAILGNMEKVALLLFIPYFFDALMFIRFRFIDRVKSVEAFGKVSPDGSLDLPHDKIYDFTHLAIGVVKRVKGKAYEKDVIAAIFAFEALLAMTGIYLVIAGVL